LVQRLEHGALVDPSALVTALFHELTDVRRRLGEVEKRLAQSQSSRAGKGALQSRGAAR
jgi:hypothetical protein